MPLVDFAKLTDAQKAEVYAMYPPPWSAGPYEWWAFWIKPDGHLTRARGRHQMTPHGYIAWKEREFGRLAHRPNAEKGDISAWAPGVTFNTTRS